MQVTINIPDEMTAMVRKSPVKRDMTKLGDAALAYIFKYGFQRVNNDSGAVGKDETTADAIAKSDKKWDALVAGQVRQQRESDPVAAEAKRIAIKRLNDAFKAKGWDVKEHAESFAKNLEILRVREDIVAQAKANVEGTNSLDIEIDL